MKTPIDTERLISCRQELGITQIEAAALIGVTQPAYQRYEAGTRIPSVQVVREMANAFHTSVDYLTGECNQKTANSITIDRTVSPLLFSLIENCSKYNDEQLKRLLAYMNTLEEQRN